MSNKHYNIDYLEETARKARGIKQRSYEYFSHIKAGTMADIGCGTGIDVVELARLLGPGVSVVGVDHDRQMLDKAHVASSGLSNVRFILSEVTELPFEEHSLAGLRAERLFQHLKTPEAVVADIYRMLQPGAPAVIVETDWSSLCFYCDQIGTERKMVDFLTKEKINNGFAAKNLTAYLANAGFREIKIEVMPMVSTALADAIGNLWIDKIALEMVEKGLLNEAEHAAFFDTISTADEKGFFAFSINLVIASGIK